MPIRPISKYLLLLVLALTARLTTAQGTCNFGSQKGSEDLERALKQAPSCKSALARFSECQWGSSIDTYFASIVIPKCEQTFINSYSPQQKLRYQQEMRLCSYEYEHQEGTLYRSAAAMCAAETSAKFAANPALANQPMPRASFDCAKAQSKLELAICSDPQVGQADIVLGRVYRALYNSEKPNQRSALANDERQWLQSLPNKCHLSSSPASATALECLRKQIELRFNAIDGCSAADGADALECLKSTDTATDLDSPK